MLLQCRLADLPCGLSKNSALQILSKAPNRRSFASHFVVSETFHRPGCCRRKNCQSCTQGSLWETQASKSVLKASAGLHLDHHEQEYFLKDSSRFFDACFSIMLFERSGFKGIIWVAGEVFQWKWLVLYPSLRVPPHGDNCGCQRV